MADKTPDKPARFVPLKLFVSGLYGRLYRWALPLLVKPPYGRYRGDTLTLTRIGILRFLESWQDRIHGKVLDVGVGTWAYPRRLFADRCDYTATDVFEDDNIDVISDIHDLAATFPADSFDFVICTDVFEHVPYPWKAAKELYGVLKPGGTLLLTTPFNFHLHGTDMTNDYWRMSADGLRLLLQDVAGFEDVEVEALGHPEFPFNHTVVAKKGS